MAFRLSDIAHGRSGDKGNHANVAVIAYTPAGFAWIQDNNMRSVLERHLPHMRPHFANVRNVFFPWDK